MPAWEGKGSKKNANSKKMRRLNAVFRRASWGINWVAETTKTVETTEITEKKLIPEFRCCLFRPFRPYCP